MWQRDEMSRPAERFGTPADRPDGYAKMSALNYVEHIQAAVSIHHGTADEQVPYPWSKELFDRLPAAGKQAEHLAYPGARHNFTGSDRTLFLERVVAFFDRHLR